MMLNLKEVVLVRQVTIYNRVDCVGIFHYLEKTNKNKTTNQQQNKKHTHTHTQTPNNDTKHYQNGP